LSKRIEADRQSGKIEEWPAAPTILQASNKLGHKKKEGIEESPVGKGPQKANPWGGGSGFLGVLPNRKGTAFTAHVLRVLMKVMKSRKKDHVGAPSLLTPG